MEKVIKESLSSLDQDYVPNFEEIYNRSNPKKKKKRAQVDNVIKGDLFNLKKSTAIPVNKSRYDIQGEIDLKKVTFDVSREEEKRDDSIVQIHDDEKKNDPLLHSQDGFDLINLIDDLNAKPLSDAKKEIETKTVKQLERQYTREDSIDVSPRREKSQFRKRKEEAAAKSAAEFDYRNNVATWKLKYNFSGTVVADADDSFGRDGDGMTSPFSKSPRVDSARRNELGSPLKPGQARLVAETRSARADTEFTRSVYYDGGGNEFDPDEKFGTISPSKSTRYKKNDFTEYDWELPKTEYNRYYISQAPQGDQPWYISGHHIQSLTKHSKSIRDNIDKNYLSFAGAPEKEEEDYSKNLKDARDGAINKLDTVLENLKKELEMRKFMRAHGGSPTRGGYIAEGVTSIEKYYKDVDGQSKEKLLASTYEAILYNLRSRERELLNKKRDEQFNRHRPPNEKWWELKSEDFCEELYRNRMQMKPNNENQLFLDELKKEQLY
mmetsp:Transcript_24511/g.27876  ORF Transcript_24511/g.27876 Transcript_24511/m.27876 type:complete len:494 (-) Transcript_24511:445-1926(-)